MGRPHAIVLWVVLLVVCFPVCRLGAASDFSLSGTWIPGNSLQSLDLSDFVGLGAYYEKYLAIFGFENGVTYYNHPVDAEGHGDGGLAINSNVTLNLPLSGKFVYISGGIGLLHKFGTSLPDIGSSFMTNIGGGLKLRKMLGRLGLRLGYRRCRVWGVQGMDIAFNELGGGVIMSLDR